MVGNEMPRIQFLAFEGCPLAQGTRRVLENALTECGLRDYEEVNLLDPETPEELRAWGSPTILINGRDATGAPRGDTIGCRVYPTANRLPDRTTIVTTIKAAISSTNSQTRES